MYSNNRENYRKAFAETWQKHIKKLPLDAVETDIVAIMIMHPEYRYLLDSNSVNTTEFEPEENPFIHMSLHIALREQIRINRPDGIAAIYENLMSNHENTHDVEHYMITILANLLWQAQETGEPPKENVYLERLRDLV